LYPNDSDYYVIYDSVADLADFSVGAARTPIVESEIPSTARFFIIQFYDPISKSTVNRNVAKISTVNKGYEIAQVIKHITAITHVKDVIVIGHSMGGLDARAYIENLASGWRML